MAETFVNTLLAGSTGLSNSLGNIYTVPASTKLVNGTMTLCNTGAVSRKVRVGWGGYYLLYDDDLASHETMELAIPHVLNASGVVQAMQDAGSDVHLLLSGVLVTGTP